LLENVTLIGEYHTLIIYGDYGFENDIFKLTKMAKT